MGQVIHFLLKEYKDIGEVTAAIVTIGKKLADEYGVDVEFDTAEFNMNAVSFGRPEQEKLHSYNGRDYLEVKIWGENEFFKGPQELPYGKIQALKDYGVFLSIENSDSNILLNDFIRELVKIYPEIVLWGEITNSPECGYILSHQIKNALASGDKDWLWSDPTKYDKSLA